MFAIGCPSIYLTRCALWRGILRHDAPGTYDVHVACV